MLHPSDNELDKLARDASENYEAPGAAPHWDAMEASLQKHMPVKKDRRIRFFLILCILLFLSGSGLLMIMNTKSNKVASNKKQDIISTENKLPLSADTAIAGSLRTSGQPKAIALVAPPKNKKGTSPHQKSIQNKKTGFTNLIITGAETAEDHSAPKNDPSGTVEVTTDNDLQDTGIDVKPADEKTIIPRDNMAIVIQEPGKSPDTGGSAGDTIKSIRKNKKPVKNKKGLEISLIYAPELTTIKFSHIDKPGSNYGILLGYRISNRVALQTGFIKSRKNYTADGDDYTVNYWLPASYKLNKATGYCQMLELPLNVKYTFTGSRKAIFFITGGISSYFMKKEFYTLRFTHNNYYVNRTHSFNSQKNYWLSVATMGLGVEKNISKNFNLGVAPFMKIPFKNMGQGDLKLISSGILFSLSYKPSFNKKK